MEKILIAAGVALAALLFVVIRSYLRSVRGVWVQEEEEGWLEILIDHAGPFASGRCYVEGGHYEYTGLWTGGSLRVRRRDHGQQLLQSKGFPEQIAQKLEGAVMAKFSLRLTDPDTLSGFFYPQLIKWNRAKTHLVTRKFVDPKWRTWMRRESEAAKALIERKEAERQAREEASHQDGGQPAS
jgi:hypothetical protein